MTKAQILVVEDEGVVALNIQTNLENLGYHVPITLASGEEAILEIEQNRPDLVLMDIMLDGEMDGVETAGRIRERFDIPLIYLTASSDHDTLRRAKVTEPYGFLIKPLDSRELYTTIEVALHKHEAERRRREVAAPDDAIQRPRPEPPAEEIPQRATDAEADVPGEAAAPAAPLLPEEQTILVIEDDPLTASLVEMTLSTEGYQVLTAPHGFQGLKMAQETPPDLILLDLMLPGLDGFEVLNRLRADPQTAGVSVVILSAKDQLSDRQFAERLGADAYLTKNYDREELLDLVRSLLHGAPEEQR